MTTAGVVPMQRAPKQAMGLNKQLLSSYRTRLWKRSIVFPLALVLVCCASTQVTAYQAATNNKNKLTESP